MTDAIDRLIRRLDLEPVSADGPDATWLGRAGELALNTNNAIFGGMVLAQTVMAAGRTVPERSVHSISQMFLRAGRANELIEYRCRVLFEGRMYSMLSIEAVQGDDVIAHAQAGLTAGAGGPDRHEPQPETVPLDTTVNRDKLYKRDRADDQPVELRVDPDRAFDDSATLTHLVKPSGSMPEDPLMHQATLAWVSDRGFMRNGWKPHEPAEYKGASLDHSIWFHRPIVFDDWHSYCMHSPSMADGRGLINGAFYDPSGLHVASTTQQGNYRPL